MDIRFSLEDDNDVDVKIDGDSIQIEIDAAKIDVADAEDKLELITSAIDNLITVKQHIKKFGITPQFLHLVNENNSLGSAIGMMLPHYESENENLDQIEEDEIPDVEVVVETIGEAVSKAKEKFLAALKWLKEKALALWNKIQQWLGIKSKKVEEAIIKTEPTVVEKVIKENMQAYAEAKGTEKNNLSDQKQEVQTDNSHVSEEPEIRTRPTITAAELIGKIEDLEENESFNIYKYYVIDADTKAKLLVEAWDKYFLEKYKQYSFTKKATNDIGLALLKLFNNLRNIKIDDKGQIIFNCDSYNVLGFVWTTGVSQCLIDPEKGFDTFIDHDITKFKLHPSHRIEMTIQEAGWSSTSEWKKDLLKLIRIITSIQKNNFFDNLTTKLTTDFEKLANNALESPTYNNQNQISFQFFTKQSKEINRLIKITLENLSLIFRRNLYNLNNYESIITKTCYPN